MLSDVLVDQRQNPLNVDILDLHEIFSDPEYDRCFMDDGIHLKQHGLKRIARALDAKIRLIAQERELGSGPS